MTTPAHPATPSLTVPVAGGDLLVHDLSGPGTDPGAPLVVLIHGITSSGEAWSAVLDALGDAFTPVTVDLRGHGASGRPECGYLYDDYIDDLDRVRNLGGEDAASFVDKDLRTLLGHPVKGRFNLAYCGGGSLDACRADLWAAVHEVSSRLAAEQGADPSAWRSRASRTRFTPGLIPDTIRTTNRPTFQQVLELVGPKSRLPR